MRLPAGDFFLRTVKLILAVAILVILLNQLLTVINDAGAAYQRWLKKGRPHGNPIKIDGETVNRALVSGKRDYFFFFFN